MGLFGYSEKDYMKNTAVFKGKLNDIIQDVGSRRDLATDAMVGNTLSAILLTLGYQERFPKQGDKKVLKQIDDRVGVIISQMYGALQKDDISALNTHVGRLKTTVELYRKYGAEMPEARELDAQDKLCEVQAMMNSILTKRIEIKRQMAEIEKKSDKIENDDDPRLEQLGRDYEDCQEKMASLKASEDICRANYQEIRDVINSYAEESVIDDMPELLSPVELNKHFSKLAMKQEKYYAKRAQNKETIEQYKQLRDEKRGTVSTGESSLMAKRRLKKQEEMDNAISNSTVEEKAQSDNPILRRLDR